MTVDVNTAKQACVSCQQDREMFIEIVRGYTVDESTSSSDRYTQTQDRACSCEQD